MGMPQIPDGKNRPSFDQTIIDLLESIALEEMAIAHMMNAEGEKTQELIKRFGCCDIGFCQLQSSSKSSQILINGLIMKEWLLVNKMANILEIQREMPATFFSTMNMDTHCKSCEK
ncbi:MAG: hypothetical protein R3Y24_07505 [Eubacteriales bacterium]